MKGTICSSLSAGHERRAAAALSKMGQNVAIQPKSFDVSTHPWMGRGVAYYGQPSRQRLVAYLAKERMQSWESVEAFDPTLSYYRATYPRGLRRMLSFARRLRCC
jgi:hypothetical protein